MTFILILMMMSVHTVDVTWTQSTDPTVAYNKVYRSHKLNGTWNRIYTSTSPIVEYVDGNVALNTTYCYEATAVDANGLESIRSNGVCVKIPSQ